MKKFISLLLVLAMAISLCACAGSGESNQDGGDTAASGLQIGYAKIDITPDFSVGLGGSDL